MINYINMNLQSSLCLADKELGRKQQTFYKYLSGMYNYCCQTHKNAKFDLVGLQNVNILDASTLKISHKN